MPYRHTLCITGIPCAILAHLMPFGDGFECGHHVGWFRVVRGGAACTLVLVYVLIRLSEVK
jgi:hypothetical protein